MTLNAQIYSKNGVAISKEKILVGDKVTLTYAGILAKSGADIIFAHVGYGELWDEKLFIPMDLIDDSFKTTFKVTQGKDLNISFKDSADNWDNNSTKNYSFNVVEKAKAIKSEDSVKQNIKVVETEKEDDSKQVKKATKIKKEDSPKQVEKVTETKKVDDAKQVEKVTETKKVDDAKQIKKATETKKVDDVKQVKKVAETKKEDGLK